MFYLSHYWECKSKQNKVIIVNRHLHCQVYLASHNNQDMTPDKVSIRKNVLRHNSIYTRWNISHKTKSFFGGNMNEMRKCCKQNQPTEKWQIEIECRIIVIME